MRLSNDPGSQYKSEKGVLYCVRTPSGCPTLVAFTSSQLGTKCCPGQQEGCHLLPAQLVQKLEPSELKFWEKNSCGVYPIEITRSCNCSRNACSSLDWLGGNRTLQSVCLGRTIRIHLLEMRRSQIAVKIGRAPLEVHEPHPRLFASARHVHVMTDTSQIDGHDDARKNRRNCERAER